MIYSIRHSSRQDSHIPLLLVYLGQHHPLELSHHPHGTRFCLLYHCTGGRGEFVIDGQRCFVQAGQLVLVRPHVPLSCKALTADCTIDLLGMTGPCCESLLDTCALTESGIYQIRDDSLFQPCLEQMLRLHQQDAAQAEYTKLCYALLVELSSRVSRLRETQSAEPSVEAVQMVISYLETHYQQPVSLDVLAEEVHLTKEYLCALFKRETGHTILNYLTLIRIGWARLYLEQYPEKKACEIGRMCGFESPSYFGKRFKAVVGITPESYRRVNSIVV